MDREEQREKVKDFHTDVLLREVRGRYKRWVMLFDGAPGDDKGYGVMYSGGEELACAALCKWGEKYVMKHWKGNR